jgi:hypothetical protein
MSQSLSRVPGHNVVFEAGQYWYKNKKTGMMSGIEEMKDRVATGYRGSPSPPPSINKSQNQQRQQAIAAPKYKEGASEHDRVLVRRERATCPAKAPKTYKDNTFSNYGYDVTKYGLPGSHGRGSLYEKDMAERDRRA